MITVSEHRDEVLSQIRRNPEVQLPLDRAVGLVTTQDILSAVDLPRFDNSAMDGYAVKASEVAEASEESPLSITVNGDIPAGDTEQHVHVAGRAWRIMTGAPMPEGADAVVPVEDTDDRPRETLIRKAPKENAHIRRAGGDLRAGDVIVRAGTLIGPAQVAAIASAGVAHVFVTAPVRVVVFSTGDELRNLDEPIMSGQIIDSNGPMLAAAVREAGFYAVHIGHLPDQEKVIEEELRHHLTHADAIITTGGVSKGAYDAVKAVLKGKGSMEFPEVAMQPGKPQGFGVLGKRRVPVFTLPGNPVSALVSFEIFVRPALAVRAGRAYETVTYPAVVLQGWRSPEGKVQYARVGVERDSTGAYAVAPAGGTGSHMVGGLAQADALAVVDAEVSEVSAGSTLRIILLGDRSELDARLAAQSAPLTEDAQEEHEDSAKRSGGRGRHRGR
ncbi:MAG: gephyrin-like molybdotransferase Glp [Ornithinimicrobium sp.]